MSQDGADAITLDDLYAVIESRRGDDPAVSHTARLFADGRDRIAKKLGEEAVETVIEAVHGDTDGVRRESADLLYHLLVLWAEAGIRPDEVWAELAARRGMSGIEEKQSRT
jgi:phosphoribosyl-ATP pyrophosphohydrolase